MNDDIRHPRSGTNDGDKNKQSNATSNAPEEGFAAANANASRSSKQRRLPRISLRNITRKQQVIAGLAVAILVIGGGGGAYALLNRDKSVPAAEVTIERTAEAPKPTTEASKLTGEQIDPALNKGPVTGIMIENSPDARPQSGLKDAGVVYEAIAEGGITRFLTLFQQGQPDYIGPVRSVRPYYVEFLLPYDASIVHAGGSADGLAKVRNLGVKDLDHGANGGAFQRVSDRYAPHNLYTSMAKLNEASTARGYHTSEVKSLLRKQEQPGQAVTAKAIELNLSAPLYNVHYDYNPASNTYNRSMANRPHTDHRSGQQLSPKVVLALVMNYSQQGIYSVYQTSGTNRAYVFQDGTVQQINWTKSGEREQFVFTDDAGKPVGLNPGQTWITIVKEPSAVTFNP